MSDALARPYDPFEITPRYVWVECPLDDYRGFAVKVRSNLRNRDRKALMDLIADVDDERKRLAEKAQERIKNPGDAPVVDLVELIEEMTRLQDENTARIHRAIAPYVVGWNLQERDTDTGETTDFPAPAQAGIEAFEAVEQPMLDWIVGTIVTAYRGGKGLTDSSRTRAGSDEPASASSETTPDANAPTSPSENDPPSSENSPTPSASTLAA